MAAQTELLGGRYQLMRRIGANERLEQWEARDTALERVVLVDMPRDAAETEKFWEAARAAARTAAHGARVLDGGTDAESGRAFVVREWSEGARDAVPEARREGQPGQGLAVEAPRSPQHAAPAGLTERAVAQSLPGARAPRGAPPRAAVRLRGRPRWSSRGWRGPVLAGLVVAVLVGVVMARSGLDAWLVWVNEPSARPARGIGLLPPAQVPSNGAQAGQATATPVGPPPTVAALVQRPAASPTPAATAVPTARNAGTPGAGAVTTGGTPVSGRVRVVNTDGIGVALRSGPDGPRLPGKGYDEGAQVTVIERSGAWTHVRGDDGREGWVLSVTLAG